METIIVGTDFSLPGNNAVNYATQLAKFFSARLVIVHAVPMPVPGYDAIPPIDMIGALQENAAENLEALKNEIISKNYDFGIDCVSELGSTFGVIKNVVNRYSADLVVLGMVGESGFLKKHLIGSSAIQAARDLTIPVFIIPEVVAYHRIQHICFACDMDKIEETTLLQTARYFANVFDAEIELVTIRKNNNEIAMDKSETYAFVESRLQNTKHKSVFIKDDNTSQALEYYFKFHKTNLVMVNPKKHGFFQTVFEARVTQTLAFNIQVPLLIIH